MRGRCPRDPLVVLLHDVVARVQRDEITHVHALHLFDAVPEHGGEGAVDVAKALVADDVHARQRGFDDALERNLVKAHTRFSRQFRIVHALRPFSPQLFLTPRLSCSPPAHRPPGIPVLPPRTFLQEPQRLLTARKAAAT